MIKGHNFQNGRWFEVEFPSLRRQPLPSCSLSDFDLKRCCKKVHCLRELIIWAITRAALLLFICWAMLLWQGKKKKIPSSIYLHIEGLACQQLQTVDKGFCISCNFMDLFSGFVEQKVGEEGRKLVFKCVKVCFPLRFLAGCQNLLPFPPPKNPTAWNNRRNSLQMYHFNALECFCF